jgi:hypothetical protein
MPSPLDILRILPEIIKLFPEILSPVVRGKLIPLNNISPATDAEQMEALNRAVKLKPRKGFNDAIHVIKCSDVKSCLEEKLDKSLLLEVLKSATRILAGDPTSNAGNIIGDRVMECIRENCLRSDTPRVKKTKDYFGRPAKGHGFGRH